MNAFTNIARHSTRAIFATFTVWLLLLTAPVAAQTTSGNATTGSGLWSSKGCSGCHAATSPTKANASNAGGHITYANTQLMGGQADSNGTQYNDIAAYLATLFTDLAPQGVTFATATPIVIPNVTFNTGNGDYVGLRQVAAPARGTTAFTVNSTTMTYTPNSGQCGPDSFTYQAYRTTDGGTSNTRTVSLTITNPAAPVITGSSGTASGTVGTPFSYTPSSSGGAVNSYSITGGTLPAGLNLNPSTGVISGTPITAGTTTLTLNAFNCSGGSLTGQTSTKSITFSVITVPGAPTIGSATPGPAQISVTFTAPVSNGGSAIINYTATCAGISASNPVSPVVVTGLTNGTAYTCTVKANNAAGSSAASSPSTSATPVSVPGAPTIGTATAGNAQISVAFTAPVSNGGSAIINYTATCSGISTSNTISPVIVTGLTNGTTYTCTVKANNAAGSSAASSPSTSATPITAPGAPTIGAATAGDAQISVAFTAPVSNGGSAIINYTATCAGFSASNAVSPVVVTGLTNGTAYTCTVVATNASGPSAASSASNSVTPATVPGAPAINGVVSGDARATIIFTAPAFNGGSAITSYTVTCTPSGTGTSTASPIAVTGLTNTTAYTCSVHSTNAIGNSAASGTVTVTPVKGSVLVPIIDFLFD